MSTEKLSQTLDLAAGTEKCVTEGHVHVTKRVLGVGSGLWEGASEVIGQFVVYRQVLFAPVSYPLTPEHFSVESLCAKRLLLRR